MILDRLDPSYSLSAWDGDPWKAYAYLTSKLLARRLDRDVFAVVDLQEKPYNSPVYLEDALCSAETGKGVSTRYIRHVRLFADSGRAARLCRIRLEGCERPLRRNVQACEREAGAGQLCKRSARPDIWRILVIGDKSCQRNRAVTIYGMASRVGKIRKAWLCPASIS